MNSYFNKLKITKKEDEDESLIVNDDLFEQKVVEDSDE